MSGFNIPFISGTKLGRDHTQYGTVPFADRPPDSDPFSTFWPIGFTLDEMMQLSWLVREWAFTGTGHWAQAPNGDTVVYDQSAQDPTPPPSPPFPSWDAQENIPRRKNNNILLPSNPIPDERWISCAYGPEAQYIATPRIPIPGGFAWRLLAIFESMAVAASALPYQRYPLVYFDESNALFYPLLFLRVTMRAQNIPGPQSYAMTSLLAEVAPPLINGRGSVVGTCTILGHTFSLYSMQFLTGIPTPITLSGTFQVSPSMWWEFKNTLGETIYDPATGIETGANPFA